LRELVLLGQPAAVAIPPDAAVQRQPPNRPRVVDEQGLLVDRVACRQMAFIVVGVKTDFKETRKLYTNFT
jgi:hypothetical protein